MSQLELSCPLGYPHPLAEDLVIFPAPLLPIQLLLRSTLAGSSERSIWVTETNVGDQDEVLDSWLWSGPTLAVADTWGVSQQMKDLSLCLSKKQRNKETTFFAHL